MSSIKEMIGRKMEKSVKFMGQDVKISKLSVAEVTEIQEQAQNITTDTADGFKVLKLVIRSGVEGGEDLTDEDFKNFPLDELSKLSGEILKFSGIGTEQGKS